MKMDAKKIPSVLIFEAIAIIKIINIRKLSFLLFEYFIIKTTSNQADNTIKISASPACILPPIASKGENIE